MTRLLTLIGFVLSAAVLAVFAGAAPAMAHDTEEHGGSAIASDARSVIVAEQLPPGVTLDDLQNGLALRLRNDSRSVVSVPDPGLEVPPGGWVQWHLDAAHADPGPHPAVQPWRVVVSVDGVPHEVRGEVRWEQGPSPWPWLVGAAALAAAVALALWRPRRADLLAVPLGAAVLVSIGHTAAALAARTAEGSRVALLGDYLPQAGCWVLGILAVALLVRGRTDGQGLGALAALGLVLVTLAKDGAALGAPVVLVAVPADLDRLAIACTVGLAAGMLAALPRVATGQRAVAAHGS